MTAARNESTAPESGETETEQAEESRGAMPAELELQREEMIKLYRELSAEREERPRPPWRENLLVLGTVLVPLLVCGLGTLVTLRQVHFQNEQAERTARHMESTSQREAELQRATVSVSQANMVQGFLDALTSDDPRKRKLAVQAVLVALPQLGAELAKIVEQTDPDTTVRAAATDSVSAHVAGLVSQLSSADESARSKATDALNASFHSDPRVVSAVETHLRKHEDEDSAYHSVVLLNSLDRSMLRAQRAEVSAIAAHAERAGPRAAEQARLLRGHLD